MSFIDESTAQTPMTATADASASPATQATARTAAEQALLDNPPTPTFDSPPTMPYLQCIEDGGGYLQSTRKQKSNLTVDAAVGDALHATAHTAEHNNDTATIRVADTQAALHYMNDEPAYPSPPATMEFMRAEDAASGEKNERAFEMRASPAAEPRAAAATARGASDDTFDATSTFTFNTESAMFNVEHDATLDADEATLFAGSPPRTTTFMSPSHLQATAAARNNGDAADENDQNAASVDVNDPNEAKSSANELNADNTMHFSGSLTVGGNGDGGSGGFADAAARGEDIDVTTSGADFDPLMTPSTRALHKQCEMTTVLLSSATRRAVAAAEAAERGEELPPPTPPPHADDNGGAHNDGNDGGGGGGEDFARRQDGANNDAYEAHEMASYNDRMNTVASPQVANGGDDNARKQPSAWELRAQKIKEEVARRRSMAAAKAAEDDDETHMYSSQQYNDDTGAYNAHNDDTMTNASGVFGDQRLAHLSAKPPTRVRARAAGTGGGANGGAARVHSREQALQSAKKREARQSYGGQRAPHTAASSKRKSLASSQRTQAANERRSRREQQAMQEKPLYIGIQVLSERVANENHMSELPSGLVEVLEVDKSGLKGKAIIGERTVPVHCRGRNILVRTGAGWLPFQQYTADALKKLLAALDEAEAAAAEDERLLYGDTEEWNSMGARRAPNLLGHRAPLTLTQRKHRRNNNNNNNSNSQYLSHSEDEQTYEFTRNSAAAHADADATTDLNNDNNSDNVFEDNENLTEEIMRQLNGETGHSKKGTANLNAKRTANNNNNQNNSDEHTASFIRKPANFYNQPSTAKKNPMSQSQRQQEQQQQQQQQYKAREVLVAPDTPKTAAARVMARAMLDNVEKENEDFVAPAKVEVTSLSIDLDAYRAEFRAENARIADLVSRRVEQSLSSELFDANGEMRTDTSAAAAADDDDFDRDDLPLDFQTQGKYGSIFAEVAAHFVRTDQVAIDMDALSDALPQYTPAQLDVVLRVLESRRAITAVPQSHTMISVGNFGERTGISHWKGAKNVRAMAMY